MNKKLKRVLWVILVLVILLACLFFILNIFFLNQLKNIFKPSDVGLKLLPCDPISQIELGYPLVGENVAEFTTNGGNLYVTARKFDHVGILDPKKWSVNIYVGNTENLPSWDSRRGIITNIVQKANFSEGNYGELNLKKGRYWLWSSSNDVVIYSCEEGGVSDPKPVWR